MSTLEFNILHIVHLTGVLLLVGTTFYAFAGAPETKKTVLTWSGISSLVVLLTGIRMWQAQFSWAATGWLIAMVIAWLGMTAFAGIAYRRRQLAGLFAVLTIVLGAIAIAMVYIKPF